MQMVKCFFTGVEKIIMLYIGSLTCGPCHGSGGQSPASRCGGLGSRPANPCGFVVEKVVLEHVFLRVIQLSPVNIIPQLLPYSYITWWINNSPVLWLQFREIVSSHQYEQQQQQQQQQQHWHIIRVVRITYF
jgi:hypothetical protein